MGLPAELLVGVHEIDEQHGMLFDILEKLQGMVKGRNDWSAVYFALDELAHFTRTHFVVEEALMRVHDYPELEQHRAEHRLFSERLAQLAAQAVREDVSLSVIGFIEDWLVNHIGASDKAYVACLRTMPLRVAAA